MTVFLRAGFGLVLRVDHERWGQTGEYPSDLALSAGHARSRERFLALHNYTAEMEPDQEQGCCEVLRHQHGCLGTRFGRSHLMSAERIRELNDRFRTTMTGGRMLMTAGVNALPSDVKAMVIRRVAIFSEFTADNDPHEEHDFGNFELAGRKFFFKIDYFDANMEFGSEDPADPAKTTRALTIMLAEEY